MSSQNVATPTAPLFCVTPLHWALLLAGVLALALASVPALGVTIEAWLGLPEYSHGLLVPALCAFLVWQRRDELAAVRFAGAWSGLAMAAAGLLLHATGRLSALFVLQQYGMLVVLYGLLLATVGWATFRRLWVPLLLLALAIPLPQFLIKNFSAHMQLVSSEIGVWFIRLFGISVYLEGNVIDLGGYKLQVAEACDGLRYLFPLMTLGLVMAYFFKAPLWQRLLVFLSSVPITILMNSLRIGVIGITVEHWGVRMAEGFLHEFQGWLVFMASAGLMLLEMALLARAGGRSMALREVFSIDLPAPLPPASQRVPRGIPPPLIITVAMLAVYAAVVMLRLPPVERRVERAEFAAFPLQVGTWQGRGSALESVYLAALKLDDYLLADFRRDTAEPPVNFYVAWYDSQRTGQSAHSPRSCIPGGGWRISSLDSVALPGVARAGQPLRVNRAVIERGSERQLVYYWFQQRGRIITNEYLVKWYILVDALRMNRTDGALVRVVTPLASGEDLPAADRRLTDFVRSVQPGMRPYVPE